jgi:hypothetical protein
VTASFLKSLKRGAKWSRQLQNSRSYAQGFKSVCRACSTPVLGCWLTFCGWREQPYWEKLSSLFAKSRGCVLSSRISVPLTRAVDSRPPYTQVPWECIRACGDGRNTAHLIQPPDTCGNTAPVKYFAVLCSMRPLYGNVKANNSACLKGSAVYWIPILFGWQPTEVRVRLVFRLQASRRQLVGCRNWQQN